MRIVFAGTPDFADRALRALIAAGHDLELVLTQPDRPAGRGKRLTKSPVKQTAEAAGLQLYQPERLRDPATWRPIADAAPEIMVVAAYGLILPQGVLDIPAHGCLNIHASLLPRWRGAAPIQRAIEAGDQETGITIMRMDAGLDTGPMCLLRSVPIGPQDTGGQLHDRLAALGAESIIEALALLARQSLACRPQPDDGHTYARKIDPAERRLDWSRPAPELHDRIRAFDPVPGCMSTLAGEPALDLKIWSSRLADAGDLPSDSRPGRVLLANGERIIVATGQGALELGEVQRPGARRMSCVEFQRGRAIKMGELFV